ncbi:DeoR/GlpR family DNA-binding transcription regulator [Streptomyces sp. NPDC088910]|uniref:DeoR/GlpR family DNA-binding transcription regulator n=1 Tax=Streptomyces sp. NPDC088910 TaxID=3365911 RepID=UPI00380E7C82
MSVNGTSAHFAEERRRALLDQLKANGRLEVVAAADRLEVTSETIRRDLVLLERRGLVQRVHGGAILLDREHLVPDLQSRRRLMAVAKDLIAHAAVKHMPDEGAVIIDAGTTTGRMAEIFPGGPSLVVMTNSLQAAIALAGKQGLSVHTLGGRVRANTLAEVDAPALGAIARVHVDVAFIGTYGVSPRHGFSTPDPAEAAVKEAMIRAAKRTVVLCDSSKIGKDHFARFADTSQPDLLITDADAPPELLRALEISGLAIEVVPIP